MFLFIFESIGTSELILVGIVALIFLGPRKLPELAKKAGKIMAEFRGTANEFKQTWEREVNFEEETKSLSLQSLDAEVTAHENSSKSPETTTVLPDAPIIKSVDPDSFKHLMNAQPPSTAEGYENLAANPPRSSEKKNWL